MSDDPKPRFECQRNSGRCAGRSGRFLFALVGGVSLVGAGYIGMASPSRAATLVPHAAFYELKMENAKPGSDITEVRGAMYFTIEESCGAWTVEQRLAFTLTDRSGRQATREVAFASAESKDGMEYSFRMAPRENGRPGRDIGGYARQGTGGRAGVVDLRRPAAGQISLSPDALFPAAHTAQTIDMAVSGAKLLDSLIFDGSSADGAFRVSTVFGRSYPPAPADSEDLLAGQISWPVRAAYFALNKATDTPEFEISMQLFENGVASVLLLDYGAFSLRGELSQLKSLPRPDC